MNKNILENTATSHSSFVETNRNKTHKRLTFSLPYTAEEKAGHNIYTDPHERKKRTEGINCPVSRQFGVKGCSGTEQKGSKTEW